jgi:hypothetical protein
MFCEFNFHRIKRIGGKSTRFFTSFSGGMVVVGLDYVYGESVCIILYIILGTFAS